MGIETPERVDPAAFARRYDIPTPYVVYVGRVSPSKSCDVLLDHFVRYKAAHPGPLTLALVGRSEIAIPNRPDVVAVGFVSDEDKFSAIAGAELFLLPSRLESLSMAFLESLALGTPVLCDGSSPVLSGHCRRSNAGLYYSNYPEFEAGLELLLANPRLRRAMARRGRQYVQRHYTWEQVLQKYRRWIDAVAQEPWW